MYRDMLKDLNIFLLEYYITTSTTDIFEEALLKMAQIKVAPRKCQFGVIQEENQTERIFFRVRVLGWSDASKFLAFLKTAGYDQSATLHYNDEWDGYQFEMDMARFYLNIYPLFKHWIKYQEHHHPQTILSYQAQSADASIIKQIKLLEQITEIRQSFIGKMSGIYHALSRGKSLSSVLDKIANILKAEIREDANIDRSELRLLRKDLSSVTAIYNSSVIRAFCEDFESYYQWSQSSHRYYILFRQGQDELDLAKGAARMQVTTHGFMPLETLPVNVQAKIAEFVGYPQKRLSQFAEGGRAMLPLQNNHNVFIPDLSKKEKRLAREGQDAYESLVAVKNKEHQKKAASLPELLSSYDKNEKLSQAVFSFFNGKIEHQSAKDKKIAFAKMVKKVEENSVTENDNAMDVSPKMSRKS